VECCGLTLIVHEITHGKNVLDKVITNRPDLFSSCVLRSLLKTKHMAVLVSSAPSQVSCHVNQRKHVPAYDVCTPCINRLRAAIVYNDWSAVYHTDDATEMYGLFCFYGSVKIFLRVVCLLKWSVLDHVILTSLRHL